MAVYRGRPEVTAWGRNDAIDPTRTFLRSETRGRQVLRICGICIWFPMLRLKTSGYTAERSTLDIIRNKKVTGSSPVYVVRLLGYYLSRRRFEAVIKDLGSCVSSQLLCCCISCFRFLRSDLSIRY
jgi:hypothetical protein